MKISAVTLNHLKDYIRLDGDDENTFLTTILTGAKSYIQGFTGLTSEKMDEKEDLTLALLVLCSEMYDNRQFTVDKDSINPVAKSILCMHSVNLL